MTLNALTAKFSKIYERNDGRLFFAPGRVNLVGEHADHNGGHVLSCAVTPGVHALAAARDDHMVHLHSLNYEDRGVIQADLPSLYRLREYDWAIYPLGVMDILKKSGHRLTGADILFYGDLPHGAGLCSSASVEVLTAVIMNDLFDLNLDQAEMARLCQRAEDDFIGISARSEAQLAIALGRENEALLLTRQTPAYRYVPLRLEGCSLIIGDTNKRRKPADARYKERRAECDAALAVIQTRRAVDRLADLTPEDLEALAPALTNPVHLKRARHAVTENQRAIEAARALGEGDVELLGRLMTRSHLSLRDDYEVSGPELDALVDAALGCPGVLGSRLTGAGFDGCTVSLVRDEFVDSFTDAAGKAYAKAVGHPPAFRRAAPSAGPGRAGGV